MFLLLDLIFNPKLVNGTFTKEDVETQKRLLVEKIDSEFSEKRIYALGRAEEEMCKNELYATKRYGKRERILSLTAEDVTKAWKEMIEKSIIQINVIGSNAGDNICKEIEKRFENIDRNNLCEIKTEFVVSASEENYVSQKQSVKQGKLVIGLRAGMTDKDDNNYAIHVMTDIFGGGPYSKLFMNVREKMSLCYYCSAMMFRQKGVMLVQSGIESYNEEKAKNAILAQLEDIRNGNFSDDDIASSVKSLEDGFRSVSDSAESVAAWFTSQVCSDKFLYPEDFIEQFKNVTREDIIEVAKAVTLDTVFMLEGTMEGGVEE